MLIGESVLGRGVGVGEARTGDKWDILSVCSFCPPQRGEAVEPLLQGTHALLLLLFGLLCSPPPLPPQTPPSASHLLDLCQDCGNLCLVYFFT